jgi:hypothetical protein
MNTLGREIRLTQNPALGAVLLWRFAGAYAIAHHKQAASPLPLLFIVLPAVWHAPTATHISSTLARSGLRAFAAKFLEARPSQLDILVDLHGRAMRWRPKSLESLRAALATGLLRLGPEADVFATERPWTPDKVPSTVRAMCQATEKLAAWCASLTLHEISLILHIHF